MARQKRTTVGSKYVAQAALGEVIWVGMDPEVNERDEADLLAKHIVSKAWDVEHFPVAGKVQITLDLASLDKAAGGDE